MVSNDISSGSGMKRSTGQWIDGEQIDGLSVSKSTKSSPSLSWNTISADFLTVREVEITNVVLDDGEVV